MFQFNIMKIRPLWAIVQSLLALRTQVGFSGCQKTKLLLSNILCLYSGLTPRVLFFVHKVINFCNLFSNSETNNVCAFFRGFMYIFCSFFQVCINVFISFCLHQSNYYLILTHNQCIIWHNNKNIFFFRY